MLASPIKVEEFASRRSRVLRSLKGAVGLVLAGDGSPPLRGSWEANSDFFYLTGIRDEHGAAVLFDRSNPDPRRRIVLFLRPTDPELDQWDGFRDLISKDLRKNTGFESIMRTTYLPRMLTAAGARAHKFACLHQFATYNAALSPDLGLFRKVGERVPGTAIQDCTGLLPSMRAVKSRAELVQMRRAAAATASGFERAMGVIQPGVNELDVQRAIERGFEDAGATRPAYNSIVGTGVNATVLHYMRNDQPVGDDDIVLIDAGAEVGGYSADVTRAFPVSGKFNKQQRELYTLVLKALDAGIRAVKPGATFLDVDAAARDIIDKAGLGDTFVHGIGHHLGIDVHDPQSADKLAPGMVLTVEPGVYLQDRGIGIRLEDDILVTASGRTNLTRAIPRTIEEVEAAMRSARRKNAPKR
jgi:Xaa-Pro aminopeptidase